MAFGGAWVFTFTPSAEAAFIECQSVLVSALQL